MKRLVIASIAVLAIVGCTAAPTPAGTQDSGFKIGCGPLVNEADCMRAATVAATAKLNPPPIVAITIRRPAPGDACLTQFHPCDSNSVIVSIESGDTIQDVPLIRTATGWVRLDLIR